MCSRKNSKRQNLLLVASMGISSLLKQLKPLTTKSNVTQFASQTLAVDVANWLHRAGYACAEKLAEFGPSDPSCVAIYTKYVTSRCREMIQYGGVKRIILVFDGLRCPLKADTNAARQLSRDKKLAKARELKRQGKHKEAGQAFQGTVTVSKVMVDNVVRAVWREFGGEVSERADCGNRKTTLDLRIIYRGLLMRRSRSCSRRTRQTASWPSCATTGLPMR